MVNKIISSGANLLKSVCEQPVREARLILAYVMGCTLTDIIAGNVSVSLSDEEQFLKFVKMRADGCPFAYITGKKEFFGLEFELCEDTLIPRDDTETLVSFVLEHPQTKTLLDICCGSGCIGIAAAKNLENVSVTGVDISEKALLFSEKNAGINGVVGRCRFYVSDILTETLTGTYDMIVSNPPYIKTGDITDLDKTVKDFEPMRALDGGNDGLMFYRRICEIAPSFLNDGGILAFEIGFDQFEQVSHIMSKNFKSIGYRCDLSGIKRVVFGTKL